MHVFGSARARVGAGWTPVETHQLTNHSTVPSAADTVPMTTQYIRRVSSEARSLDRMAL